MAKSCPECGAAVEYTARAVELLEGSCSGCGRSVVLLPPPGPAASALASAASGSGCWECGGPLSFRARPDRSVETSCSQCHAEVTLIPGSPGGSDDEDDGEASEEEEEANEDDAPRGRRPTRPFRDRGPPGGPGMDRGGPRFSARPCRQCGGTLQFASNPDGSVTGSCAACGNEFTMRARPDGPSGYPRRPSWGGGGGAGGRRRFSPAPRGPWQDRSRGPPDRRRRRRPTDDR